MPRILLPELLFVAAMVRAGARRETGDKRPYVGSVILMLSVTKTVVNGEVGVCLGRGTTIAQFLKLASRMVSLLARDIGYCTAPNIGPQMRRFRCDFEFAMLLTFLNIQ